MSFILDALKKSENERQQQTDSEFATVPSASDSSGMPRWLWVLGGLLVVNAVVVTGLLLRPDAPAVSTTVAQPSATTGAALPETPATAVESTPAPSSSFAERIDAARENQVARTVPTPEPEPEPAAASPAVVSPAPVAEAPAVVAAQAEDPAMLPSIQEVVANGTLQLPPMHIDIHVYSDTPGDRFVFINMNKYRENERLDEGPVVLEITRDGVVLTHRGTEFFLSRD